MGICHISIQQEFILLHAFIITSALSAILPFVTAAEFKCTTVGKFEDTEERTRYHQCFYLFGKLTHIHNICPVETCFSAEHNYCLAEACKKLQNAQEKAMQGRPVTDYNCGGASFKCFKKGVFAYPKDSSIYFKCSKVWGKWTYICYTCNSKHKTCFDNELQACIPNGGRPCTPKLKNETNSAGDSAVVVTDVSGDSGDGESASGEVVTRTYDCEGYNYFPCDKLFGGLHGFPGDLSVYMECRLNEFNKMEGICHVCPQKRSTCFVERIDQCVENCGQGTHHEPYNCSTYTSDYVDCEIEGLNAQPMDTSVFFNCSKNGDAWDTQCFTCSNGKMKTCFSELQQACVTYTDQSSGTDHKCPPILNMDGGTADLGTADDSLTWDCDGYNEGSFPCANFGKGVYPTPADRSVYFQCSKRGSEWVAECKSCPSKSWSCFDAESQECVRDCVPPKHMHHDCRTYDEYSYPCSQTGYFANFNDTSIFHQCVFSDGRYQALCYTCSNGQGNKLTCFDTDAQACVRIGGEGKKPCGTVDSLSANPNKGQKEDSMTYSKEGYSETSFPCQQLGAGEWDFPGDASVYVQCGTNGDTEFKVCPESSKSCYDKDKKKCVENCGEEQGPQATPRPSGSYSCDVTFNCTEEGVFQYVLDTSIYFSCKNINGSLKDLCFPCNSHDKTCYSAQAQACVVTKNLYDCGTADDLKGGEKAFLSYNCKGYTESAFPCETLGAGYFGVPGDKSVFIECYRANSGQILGKCHSCPESGNSCYDEETKVCVTNCGKGDIHQPYDCSTYDERSYPCTKEGYFANSLQTSIYFQCVKVGETWRSYCYTCNSVKQTCFNENKQACVTNGERPCGNTTMPVEGGTKTDSLSYTCEGYNEISFPCGKLGQGRFVMPGDPSVYWTCKDDGRGECQACVKGSCFNEAENQCAENCGLGMRVQAKPYNCSTYNKNSFNCSKEGFFANPKDPSIYFRCKKVEIGLQLDCFTCNSRNKTCFDDVAKKCVDIGGIPCTERISELLKPDPSMVRTPARMYSCMGYEGFTFNCPAPGNYTVGGDMSIYFTCAVQGSVLLPQCKACPKETKGCFDKESNKCVDNCGKGIQVNGTIRPYDCSGYHPKSYPCSGEGFYANPQDPTVFFQCVKVTGEWQSWCYACNSRSQSCFNSQRKRCVIGCPGKDNGTGIVYGDNCNGYNKYAIPCRALANSAGARAQVGNKTYFAHVGDPAVYFLCVYVSENYQALCHRCPVSGCFDQATQTCTAHCPEYVHLPINAGMGPPVPYNCKFYGNDSFPCNEESLNANPVDTSVYFKCVKDTKTGRYLAVCYTCNRKVQTCFNEAEATCVFSEKEPKCGTISKTKSTVVINAYDCGGYQPYEETLPCFQMGPGTWPIPGDASVYFTCNSSSTGVQCEACSKEAKSCFDPKEKKCVDNCLLIAYKPYSCGIYNETSFPCTKEGYFAQTFDSSVFFQCVKDGKQWKSMCHTCNSQLKTCFSNSLQVCLTKGGQPCGDGDPATVTIGGTEQDARHHTCNGYNNQSFPCSYSKGGLYGTPADPSIYFSCIKFGEKWISECQSCPKETDSCFDEHKKVCVENCGKGPREPYSCQSYDDKAITCTKEGLFGIPKDTTVFFQCVKSSGQFKAFCYACNKVTGTCFDETVGACVTNGGVPCDERGEAGSTIEKGTWEDSLSISCEGYNSNSTPACAVLGPGRHALPGDKSIYFVCILKGSKFRWQCRVCDPSRKAIYSENHDNHEMCVSNYGKGIHKPWNCYTRYYKCGAPGIFPDETDTSVFYKCVEKAGGKLEAQCFSCNDGVQKTCFSKSKLRCLRITGTVCANTDPAEDDPTMTMEKSRTYDCMGYNEWSFPCDKYTIPGIYATPAERSVYFECTTAVINGVTTAVAECNACNSENDSIFDSVQKKCVLNLGKGVSKPYSCETYNKDSYKCKESGLFANLKDTSIFFKCVKRGDLWESLCYTCSSSQKTCFSNSQKACVTNSEKSCGGGDPYLDNEQSGTAETSRTYSCSGYNELSFPCADRSPGDYVHPGDLSVYFTCKRDKDNRYVATCNSCDISNWGCYNGTKGVKKCVKNCNKGGVKFYDCRPTHWRSYPCTQEGGYWAHPANTQVFFSCNWFRGRLEAVCYACNANKKTCFSNEYQACITIGEEPKCGKEDPIMYEGHGTPKESRTYDKVGYTTPWKPFPCSKKGAGIHPFPGDESVYVECSQTEKNGEVVWQAKFAVCGNDQDLGFFNKATKKCEPEPGGYSWGRMVEQG